MVFSQTAYGSTALTAQYYIMYIDTHVLVLLERTSVFFAVLQT